MSAANVVKMITLVWIFSSVYEANADSCSLIISCDDVNGTVNEELTLACSISWPCNTKAYQCCGKLYKLMDSENENATTICKKTFPNNTCQQDTNISCNYFPSVKITAKFQFFFQASCAATTTTFTVRVTEPVMNPVRKGKAKLNKPEVSITAVAVICFIIIIMIIIYRKYKHTNSCGVQRDYKTTGRVTHAGS